MAHQDMASFWTGAADGWVANEPIFDAVFTPVTAAILAAADFGVDDVVLDVGCGTGTLLQAATAAGATAVGVDISPAMTERARKRVPGASVHVADAQRVDLGGLAPGAAGFNLAVSRFGVMFFDDATAAFANIRAALRPDGRLVFVCWRRRDENPMFTAGYERLFEQYGAPDGWGNIDGPGPVAFADRDRLEQVLADSGWSAVAIEALDVDLDFAGADDDGAPTDGFDERLALMLSTSSGEHLRQRIEEVDGPDGFGPALDVARAELEPFVVDGAVRLPGACWLVTAQA